MCHELHVSAGLPGPQRHAQRVEHQVSPHVRRDLPADDHAGEHVDQEREVHTSLPGAQVGQIANPQPVGPIGGEVPVDEVWALVSLGIGGRGPPRLPAPLGALDARLAHQTGDTVAADLLALAAQLVPHPRIAVALEVLRVHLLDPGDQALVLDRRSPSARRCDVGSTRTPTRPGPGRSARRRSARDARR